MSAQQDTPAAPRASDVVVRAVTRGNDADLSVIKAHLEKGLDPNAVDAQGLSLLFLAATCGHSYVAQALLEAKADPNFAAPPFRTTPLMSAAALGRSAEILYVLIEHKADPAMENAQHRNALDLAIDNGHGETFLELLSIVESVSPGLMFNENDEQKLAQRPDLPELVARVAALMADEDYAEEADEPEGVRNAALAWHRAQTSAAAAAVADADFSAGSSTRGVPAGWTPPPRAKSDAADSKSSSAAGTSSKRVAEEIAKVRAAQAKLKASREAAAAAERARQQEQARAPSAQQSASNERQSAPSAAASPSAAAAKTTTASEAKPEQSDLSKSSNNSASVQSKPQQTSAAVSATQTVSADSAPATVAASVSATAGKVIEQPRSQTSASAERTAAPAASQSNSSPAARAPAPVAMPVAAPAKRTAPAVAAAAAAAPNQRQSRGPAAPAAPAPAAAAAANRNNTPPRNNNDVSRPLGWLAILVLVLAVLWQVFAAHKQARRLASAASAHLRNRDSFADDDQDDDDIWGFQGDSDY